MMDFIDYHDLARAFAIYPHAGTRNDMEFVYLGLGLTGEAGEVAEKIKKRLRDGEFDKAAVAKELGDVLWYLSQLANAIGYSLVEVAELNIQKLSSRKDRGVINGSGDDR